jgi:PiT family inorganic phosphate transporter
MAIAQLPPRVAIRAGGRSHVQFIQTFAAEFQTLLGGAREAATAGHLLLFLGALLVACAFEFINGFHDAANAVATVIYTKSLRPWLAISWSGFCNFLGVMLGGTAVAMGIVKLLPPELLASPELTASLAMIFALLIGATVWNLGTWYFGLPASSSHTLIGSILGIGLAYAWVSGRPLSSGVNWTKATEIGLALLISPLFGFGLSALLMALSRWLLKDPVVHQAPRGETPPPWKIRATLIATSTGVSFAHGSNDGQKGMGLIMLILIAVLPGHFAVRTTLSPEQLINAKAAAVDIAYRLTSPENRVLLASKPSRPELIQSALASSDVNQSLTAEQKQRLADVSIRLSRIHSLISSKPRLIELTTVEKNELRSQILKVDGMIARLEKESALPSSKDWSGIQKNRATLKAMTDYTPSWVIVIVALSIGLGTLVGWKRIVVTIGEKIGKSELTYAQGASAGIVAMSTIGVSAFAGLPVSTTHVLSSGIAGTMVAGGGGVQGKTIRSIALAWIMTLPVSMALSAGLFLMLLKLTG